MVTHHPSQMPVCRGTRDMRWEMSCCTPVCRVMQCPVGTKPSACCVTAAGSGTEWWRHVSEVRTPFNKSPQRIGRKAKARGPILLLLFKRFKRLLFCYVTGTWFVALRKHSPRCQLRWKRQLWYLSVTYHSVSQFMGRENRPELTVETGCERHNNLKSNRHVCILKWFLKFKV